MQCMGDHSFLFKFKLAMCQLSSQFGNVDIASQYNKMATQLQLYSLIVLPFLAAWLVVFAGAFPSTLVNHYRQHFLIGAPLLIIIVLGVYAVGSVVYGVLTFNDCSQARAELVSEINEAKEELRRRKVRREDTFREIDRGENVKES